MALHCVVLSRSTLCQLGLTQGQMFRTRDEREMQCTLNKARQLCRTYGSLVQISNTADNGGYKYFL
jgi:hypothetical protein